MFEFLKKVLSTEDTNKNPVDDNKFKLQVSICMLLVDIAKIDGNFSNSEKENIRELLIRDFDVKDEEIDQMIEKAEAVLKRDDSIYDFTQEINKSLGNEQKYELLKNLWRLVFIDRKNDMYEEHLVKKIGGLLDLDNRDVIAAKLSIKDELHM